MNKLIIALGSCLVLVALSEAATRCRSQCKTGDNGVIACVLADSSGKQCRRLKECRMREENCLLRKRGKLDLVEVSKKRCRNIRSESGTGKCASARSAKTIRPIRCPIRPCKDDGVTRCWRNAEGQCQVLTFCQRMLYNCRNAASNALNETSKKSCRGMVHGSPLQKCRITRGYINLTNNTIKFKYWTTPMSELI